MRWLALLLVLLGALWARPARAERSTSALSWVRLPGSESCIAAPELGARIEKHLGRAVLVSPSVADVSIEGRTEAIGSGPARRYRVVVGGTRRDTTLIGTREMVSKGADCRSLDDGLVLVVALMIDPDALAPAPAAEPTAPAAASSQTIVTEREVVREIERVTVGPPPWIVEAAALGTLAVKRVGAAAPGVAVGMRAGPSQRVAFQVLLNVVPSGSLTVGTRDVDFTLFEGGLAYCPAVPLSRRIDVGACLGLRVGVLHAQGHGFATDRASDRGTADVASGLNLAVALVGPVYGIVTANGLIALVRQQTTVSDGNGNEIVLDRRSLLGGELGVGIGVRFSP